MLSVTTDALARVLEIRDAEDDPGTLCLRVAITGTNGTEYTYDLAFDEIAKVDEADDVSVQKGLTVVVAADSVDRMRGATLDVPSRRRPVRAGDPQPQPGQPARRVATSSSPATSPTRCASS